MTWTLLRRRISGTLVGCWYLGVLLKDDVAFGTDLLLGIHDDNGLCIAQEVSQFREPNGWDVERLDCSRWMWNSGVVLSRMGAFFQKRH
jgi:hypothetical protein